MTSSRIKYGISGLSAASMMLLLSSAMLTSCGDGNKGKELSSFSTFSVKGYGIGADTDSIARTMPDDYSGIWQITSSGVLPDKIGGEVPVALRDTLCALAGINISEKGNPEVKYPDYIRQPEAKPDTTKARSLLANRVSLDLMTPAMQVFRIYTYQMSEGAAHGVYATRYINYDLLNGKVLGLSDLFRPGYEAQLNPMLTERVAQDYPLLVEESEVKIPSNFRLTEDGIEFIYGIYEITAYAEGEPRVFFYYYQLKDLLTPEACTLFEN